MSRDKSRKVSILVELDPGELTDEEARKYVSSAVRNHRKEYINDNKIFLLAPTRMKVTILAEPFKWDHKEKPNEPEPS